MDNRILSTAECNESYDTETRKDNAAEIPSDCNDYENIIYQVHNLNDVKYFFALKGSNPQQTIKALDTFSQRVILIAGGNDENMSYDSLADTLVSKVKHLILIGQTSGIIEMHLMRKLVGKNQNIDIRITHCGTLKQAVDCAYLSARPKDSVLLSPASNYASGNYEELQEIYSKHVTAL